jgi:hypothetical protein
MQKSATLLLLVKYDVPTGSVSDVVRNARGICVCREILRCHVALNGDGVHHEELFLGECRGLHWLKGRLRLALVG